MADFELLGAEGPKEKMSEEDFEKFRETMREAAKAMAGAQMKEQRQQKKEDVLMKILLKYFQGGARSDLLMLAIQLLQMNIPPVFVLALLLLGEQELQRELEKIESSEGEPKQYNLISIERTLLHNIPDFVVDELTHWMHAIQHQAHLVSEKLLQYGADHDKKPKQKAIDLPSLVLQSYLQRNEIAFEPNLAEEFVRLMTEKIFQEMKK